MAQRAPMLQGFVDGWLGGALLDRQSEWCETFDRGCATSLLLFEHVHGESRDRGRAMVDLLAQYEQAGLLLNCRELPDYLPLYLEYLSLQPEPAARRGYRMSPRSRRCSAGGCNSAAAPSASCLTRCSSGRTARCAAAASPRR